MATIQTSLALVDNMSPVLQNISREVSNTVSKFQGLQNICQTSWNMPNLISAFSGAIKPISAVSGFVLTLAGDLSALSLATVSQSNAQSLLNSTMLTLSTTVLAASTSQQITVNANQIKVVVDGKNITADNFLYNGTTYLPLRAVSEALGKEVAYDSATQTATITSTGTSASELTMLLEPPLTYGGVGNEQIDKL